MTSTDAIATTGVVAGTGVIAGTDPTAVITVDMGGTTTRAGVCRDGALLPGAVRFATPKPTPGGSIRDEHLDAVAGAVAQLRLAHPEIGDLGVAVGATDARPEALAKIELDTGGAKTAGVLEGAGTGAKRKVVVDQFDHRAGGALVFDGSKVAAAVRFPRFREGDARPGIGQIDPDKWVLLVRSHRDVVARLITADELRFEH